MARDFEFSIHRSIYLPIEMWDWLEEYRQKHRLRSISEAVREIIYKEMRREKGG
jgi:hypothetical protein